MEHGHLRIAIREEYSQVAQNPQKGFHFISGRPLARLLDYGPFLLNGIPEGAIESFAGVGNPFAINTIFDGEKILDIGSGAGIDSLIASKMVGSAGEVTGIDMTAEMVAKARENARKMGSDHVKFMLGFAESLPFDDNSVDVVISNGAINLSPDKPSVFAEMYRVLKYGGRIQIADVILKRPVSERSKSFPQLWANCVAGGILMEEYEELLQRSGFSYIQFGNSYDVFREAPVSSWAASYEAMGYNISAYKLR